MGHKSICLNCRISFSEGTDFYNVITVKCPQCSENTFFVNQKFKPPKKTDVRQWEIVSLLVKSGFRYQTLYEKADNIELKINYPTMLKEAKSFIEKYKIQGTK